MNAQGILIIVIAQIHIYDKPNPKKIYCQTEEISRSYNKYEKCLSIVLWEWRPVRTGMYQSP